MAEKSETAFKNQIRPKLEALPKSWWEKIQQLGIVGTPDFLGCVRGRFVALELKRSVKGKLSPMQVYKLKEIEKAGGVALVAYPENWETVHETLKALARGENETELRAASEQ